MYTNLKLYMLSQDASIYCRYYVPSPEFYFLGDLEGTICHIILPSNAPMHQIVSAPQFSMEDAKRDACLKAIEELHKLGALSDYLLPLQDNANVEELLQDSSDSDSLEGWKMSNLF